MKTFKKTLITIAMLLCSISVSAHDFEADGIYYNITSSEDLTVEVTFKGDTTSSAVYSGSIFLPNVVEYNGNTYSVTGIAGSAFSDCTSLTNITIPESVTSIGTSAFYGCTGLTDITIPNSVTSIRASTFEGCTGLTDVFLPTSILEILGDAFKGCTSLCHIEIPSSVMTLGHSYPVWGTYMPFTNCTNLTTVTIESQNVASLSDLKSYFGEQVTTYILGNSVTSIGNGAFSDCTSLTNITIPNSVTSIGYSAFRRCTSLTNVSIPNSVTSIGSDAFSGCI